MRFAVIALMLLVAGGCDARKSTAQTAALQSLLAEKKFQPDDFYTGPDTAEDRPVLERAVDGAVRDVMAMTEPRNPQATRQRLSKLIRDTDLHATEDRDQVHRYAVRIWKAAGFTEESRLFSLPDEKVLAGPPF